MANTIAGVNLAEIAQESLSALTSVFAPLNAVATDFSADISARGESVTTRFPSNPSAQDLSSGYTRTDVTTTSRTVNLNTFFGFVWGFNDLERSKSAIMLNDLFIQPAATALGRKVFGDLWNLVTSSNFSASETITAANFDRGSLIDLSAELTIAGAPSVGRSIITNPTYYGSILKTLNSAEFPGFIAEKSEGSVPRVSKFNIYETDQADANAQNLQAFAMHRNALLMAARRVDATGAVEVGVQVEDILIPGLNLPVQMRKWYHPDSGELKFSLSCLYGVAVGRGEFGVRVVSA